MKHPARIGKRPVIVERAQRQTNAQKQLKAAWNELHLDAGATGKKGRFAVAEKSRRTVDDITFDSRTQSIRYTQLKMLERAKLLTDLTLEPSWDIAINGQHFCTFTADFSYFCNERRVSVIEDVKTTGTQKDTAYRLRKKAAELAHNIKITEVLL